MRTDVLIVRQSLAAVRLGLRERRVGVASPASFDRLHVETPEASVGRSVALIELDGAPESWRACDCAAAVRRERSRPRSTRS